MDESRKSSLRAQLQTDDPTAPGNAMETLAKMWADWRMKKHEETLADPQAMPFSAGGMGGIVRTKDLVTALKNLMTRNEAGFNRSDYKMLDNIRSNKPWWDEQLHSVGGPTVNKVEPLSSGAQSYAFDLIPKAPTGQGAEVLKVFKHAGPTFRQVLAHPPEGALAATRHGIAPPVAPEDWSEVGYFVQPRASQVLDAYFPPGALSQTRQEMGRIQTPWGRYSDIVRDLDQKAAAKGMSFWDDWMPNVGIYKGQPRVIDLGAYGTPGQRPSPMGSVPPGQLNWWGE